MGSTYRPGDQVPFDAYYRMFRFGENFPSIEIALQRGEYFPRTGWLFELAVPTRQFRIVATEGPEDLASLL